MTSTSRAFLGARAAVMVRAFLIGLAALTGCAGQRVLDAGDAVPPVPAQTGIDEVGDQPYLVFVGFRLAEPPHLVMYTSRDGVAWSPVNAGLPIIQTGLGIRDPFIARDADGLYHCVWTTQVADGIGYATSRDLLAWSEPRVLRIMAGVPKTWNCWAPELVWLEERGVWMVHYSSTIVGLRDPATAGGEKLNHRIYRVLTRDFQEFSEPEVLYDPGYTVIDSTIFRTGSQWTMAIKDARLRPKPMKRIRLASAASPLGPWSLPPSEGVSPAWHEGATFARFGGWWWMYVDRYHANYYQLWRSRDLVRWTPGPTLRGLPRGFRHGSVLEVPPTIFERLTAGRSLGSISIADGMPMVASGR